MENIKIVIIGAVAAGTSAAAKARRNAKDARIVLYDKDEYISYSGCGLPYYIGGQIEEFAGLVPRDAAYFKKQYDVDVFTRHEVLSVDTKTKTLQIKRLADGQLLQDNYDVLVLATGAVPVILPLPGKDKPHVFVLRSPSHVQALEKFLGREKPATAVIIGSGFIGMEMVESLVNRGLTVSLVEREKQLAPALEPELAASLEEYLLAKGVQIQAGRTATAIEDKAVLLDDGTAVAADLVLVAAGVRPSVQLARAMGVQLGPTGAIAVDQGLRTNLKDVYACGDCAENYLVMDGQPVYHPLGSTANKTGRVCGDVLSGGSETHRGIAGTGIYRVFDLAVASCGYTEKAALAAGYDVVTSLDKKLDKPQYMGGSALLIKAVAEKSSGRILGAQILGRSGVDKRIDVFVTALYAGLGAADLAQLDLAYSPPFAPARDPLLYTGLILAKQVKEEEK